MTSIRCKISYISMCLCLRIDICYGSLEQLGKQQIVFSSTKSKSRHQQPKPEHPRRARQGRAKRREAAGHGDAVRSDTGRMRGRAMHLGHRLSLLIFKHRRKSFWMSLRQRKRKKLNVNSIKGLDFWLRNMLAKRQRLLVSSFLSMNQHLLVHFNY